MSDEDFCVIHGRDDMRFDRGPIPYCAECERPPLKRGERFTIGEQPCQHFLRGNADIAALGAGNRRNLHQCPKCEGNRAWCDACHTDHHDGGWETCKPGAYADPPDED
jgi:hypothetical protein